MRHRPRAGVATLGVFIAALALHVAVVLQLRGDPLGDWPIGDALSYQRWAVRIAEHGVGAEPVFHQAPLYPLMLGAIRRVAGAGWAHALRLAVQVLLGSAALALLVPLGRLYLRSTLAGVLGAALAVLHGPFTLWNLMPVYVALALATETTAGVALAAARERPTWLLAGAAGAALGVATLARQEMMLALPVFVLALPAGPRRFRSVAALLCGWLLLIAPVTVHNLRQGDLVAVASSGGENLFIGNQRGATGDYTPLDPRAGDIFSERELAHRLAEVDAGRRLRASEISAYWRRRALREVLADPGGWLALEGRKLVRILDPGDPTDAYSFPLERDRYLPVLHLLPLPAWSLLAAGLAGLAIALRRLRRASWPLAALAGIQLLTLMLFFVNTRLRLPWLFALAPFGGLALATGIHAWREGRRRVLVASLAVAWIALSVAGAALTRPTPRDRVRLAAVLSARDRSDEALGVLEPVLSGASPDGLALDQAGWILHKRGDAIGAARYYREALAAGLPPAREVQTRTRLGMVLEQAGRIPESREQHDLAVASARATAGTYYERGMFRLRRGDARGARRDFEDAMRLDPAWPPPREALSRLDGE